MTWPGLIPIDFLPGPWVLVPLTSAFIFAFCVIGGLALLFWFFDLLDNITGKGTPVGEGLSDYEYRIAAEGQERTAALALVHDNYVKAGFIEPQHSGVHKTEHSDQLETRTFVVVRDGLVVATDTLFLDGPIGLPLDCAFGSVTRDLRRHGHELCEAGMFATRERLRPEVLLRLMLMVEEAAKDAGCDMLLTVVHPKHVKFYLRYQNFVELARRDNYPGLANAPAVLLATERWQHE